MVRVIIQKCDVCWVQYYW